MSLHRSFSILAASAIAGAILSTACTNGQLAVGKSDQQLQTQKNGQPTGNGTSCSWEGTTQWDNAGPALPPEASQVHDVGDDFAALDGCNSCTCTANGIMCTIKSCNGNGSDPNQPVACEDIAKECPDGSYVGKEGPNCEFAPCPGTAANVDESKLGADCSADFYSCPQGQTCNSFPGVGFRCAADACAAMKCAPGEQCLILESFPAQIKCAAQ
jgi:hypothetical protein